MLFSKKFFVLFAGIGLLSTSLFFTNSHSQLFAQETCPTIPTSLGTAAKTISISDPGTYTVWSLVKPTQYADSYYLVIDDNCAVNVGDTGTIATNEWSWIDFKDGSDSAKITVDMTPGTHTIKLIGREEGFAVDKVIFALDSTCIPTGFGENCLGLPTPTPTSIPTSTPTVTPTPTITPTPSDTTPPTVTITSPTNNSNVTKNSTVTIRANAADASGIQKVEFYVNNVLKCTDTTSSYTCAWQVPNTRASFTLQAKAFDTHLNTKTHTITVQSR